MVPIRRDRMLLGLIAVLLVGWHLDHERLSDAILREQRHRPTESAPQRQVWNLSAVLKEIQTTGTLHGQPIRLAPTPSPASVTPMTPRTQPEGKGNKGDD